MTNPKHLHADNLSNGVVYDGAASLAAPCVSADDLLHRTTTASAGPGAAGMRWQPRSDADQITGRQIGMTPPPLPANQDPNDTKYPKSGHATAPVGHAFVPLS